MNVPKAHSTGAGSVAQPTDHFDFGITATYLESQVDLAVGGYPGFGSRSPEFAIAANATYLAFHGPVDDFISVTQHVNRYADRGPGGRIRNLISESIRPATLRIRRSDTSFV
jgi:hypothetical protein